VLLTIIPYEEMQDIIALSPEKRRTHPYYSIQAVVTARMESEELT